MSPEDQETWLGKAEANSWSVAKLRAEIKAATVPDIPIPPTFPRNPRPPRDVVVYRWRYGNRSAWWGMGVANRNT